MGGQIEGGASVVDGQAKISLSGLAVGNYPLVAQYSGGNVYAPSSSTILNLAVVRTPTTTTLQASSNPSNVGLPITLTAFVRPTFSSIFPLQGDLEFFDGTTPIGMGPLEGEEAQLI